MNSEDYDDAEEEEEGQRNWIPANWLAAISAEIEKVVPPIGNGFLFFCEYVVSLSGSLELLLGKWNVEDVMICLGWKVYLF